MESEEIIDGDSSSKTYNYAGFWIRIGAYLIDIAILIIPIAGLQYLFFGSTFSNPSSYDQIVNLGVWWIYYAILESSSLQGTLGKKALGIKVINENGERINFGKATGRYWAMFISCLMLFIGIIQIGFDKRKQGFHDKIANCLVIYNK